MEQVAIFVIGVLAGLILLWIINQSRLSAEVARLRGEWEAKVSGLQERITAKESEVDELRKEKAAAGNSVTDLNERIRQESELKGRSLARATELEEVLKEARAERSRFEGIAKERSDKVTELEATKSSLETALKDLQETSEEKMKLLEDAKAKLTETFSALSSEVLKSNNQSFIDLAKSTLSQYQEAAKGDLEKRQLAIDHLVKPVQESLEKFGTKVGELELARATAYQDLNTQIKALQDTQVQLKGETSNLVRALSQPRVRGRWGEIQLRRVVEMAGMLDHCDFFEQVTADSGDGRLRPDMVVRLPGKKQIVIDAKTPLAAYLEAIETPDETIRQAKLTDHARQVRDHMGQLSKKSYWEQFQDVPEFVILFLPGEFFFSAALEKDPSLIETGVNQQVILATPTTLIALLKAISFGWRQEKLAENANQISELGKELYKRICDMSGHFQDIGSRLSKTVESYNKAVGSMESRVLVSARRFRDLETVSAEKEIEVLEPIDGIPRNFQSADFLPKAPAQVEPASK